MSKRAIVTFSACFVSAMAMAVPAMAEFGYECENQVIRNVHSTGGPEIGGILRDNKIHINWYYRGGCMDFYQIRWGVAGRGEQEFQIQGGDCTSGCGYSLDIDRDKPYVVRVEACRSRFLAPSRCSNWSIPAVTLPYGHNTCMDGYVWREAFPGDMVCVTPGARAMAAIDNMLAPSRRNPLGGAYGPDTCLLGYVWREAVPTDHVCVVPQTRQSTADDNRLFLYRRVVGGVVKFPFSWIS
ncbi:hypothetical protein [Sorangium sp. So ce363]|uniref:hypothetical protein n=1 Tax=Sorangium sp. So ce363 TaxID=3133304 RepID=UPI003F5EFB4E